MGKAQKIKVSKRNQPSNAPLGDQLETSNYAAPTGRVKERTRQDEDEDYVESRLSKNIMTQARLQVNLNILSESIVQSAVHILMIETRYNCGRSLSACQLPHHSLF